MTLSAWDLRMDFAWSESDCELHDCATAFARSLNGSGDESDAFSLEAWRRCGEFGLLGLSVPLDFGGGGLGALLTARVIEAFGRVCTNGGLLFSAAAHLFACTMPIVEYADAELKRTLAPKLARGELVGANAITEAEAGSDVAAVKTVATRDGDYYVLNGVKSYVTNGPVANGAPHLRGNARQARVLRAVSLRGRPEDTRGRRRTPLPEDWPARRPHRPGVLRELPRSGRHAAWAKNTGNRDF